MQDLITAVIMVAVAAITFLSISTLLLYAEWKRKQRQWIKERCRL